MDVDILIIALALAITIEGIAYALFPDGMKKMMAQVMTMPSANMRAAGIAAAVSGVLPSRLTRPWHNGIRRSKRTSTASVTSINIRISINGSATDHSSGIMPSRYLLRRSKSGHSRAL